MESNGKTADEGGTAGSLINVDVHACKRARQPQFDFSDGDAISGR
jgi:hypothetical protein